MNQTGGKNHGHGSRASAAGFSSRNRSCFPSPSDTGPSISRPSNVDRAWRSKDVAERFAAGLRARLKPGGSALVLLSTFGDGHAFLAQFCEQGFEISVLAQRRFINERLTIFRLVESNPRET